MKEIQFTKNNIADVISFLEKYNFIFVPYDDGEWLIYGKTKYGLDYSRRVKRGDYISIERGELPEVTVNTTQ